MTSQLVFLNPPDSFNPKIEVVACFLMIDKKTLFMKRQPHKSEGNLWGIPGGKCEKGENVLTACLREVEEETGLALVSDSVEYFKKVYIRYPEVDFVYHMFYHRLGTYPQIVMDPLEHSTYRWITLEEAMDLPLIRGEAECIHLFASHRLSTSIL